MTRELKLAMVIGFALLLMLAIVVSDHFSTGAADHSTLVASAQPRLAAAPPPVAVRRVESSGASPAPDSRSRVAAPAMPTDTPLAATTKSRSAVRPTGSARPTSPVAAPAATAAMPVRPIGTASTTPAVPTPRTYRVAEGDSLSSIATAFYGDAGLWNKLAAANRNRLPNPDRMRVGLLLVIPDRDELDGDPTVQPLPATVRDPLVADRPRIHVVGEGETLSEIAAAHLGSARRWPELVAANRDRITDPDRVQPGTELRLP